MKTAISGKNESKNHTKSGKNHQLAKVPTKMCEFIQKVVTKM